MVDTNENNTGSTEPAKKRSRLFGSRRQSKNAEAVTAQAVTAEAATVDAVTVEHPAQAEPARAETAQAETAQDAAAEQPAATRRRAPAKKTVDSAAGEQAGASTVRRSTTRKAAPASVLIDDEPAIGNEPAVDPVEKTPRGRKRAGNGTDAAPEPATIVRATTSLLFQAPDLPILPQRQAPRGGNQDDQDRPDDDDSTTVRRRTRRRSGEDDSVDGEKTPPNTVVKVRTPRKQPEPSNEPQRVRGSTRLEAKKQRRRDGRDAGRRRPVISEAEFLARRESVDRVMVVRSKFNRIQIGVLEDGVLVEHYVAKSQDASLIGNVYLGRVQNVLPSMEAAFVDIGRGRNAVLYSGEVDWDAAAENSTGGSQARRIELALKPGDKVLVQVTKDPVGHKGARLTSQVSLPGRYLVYVPNGSMNGISRKLPDTERARLKKILKEVLPENAGVIVRTAAEGATEEQLTLDVSRLTSQWAEISAALETVQAPALLHSEPDLLVKIVRDVFNEDFQKLVIEGDDAESTISTYLRQVAPDLIDRIQSYEGTVDSFDEYRISEQIEKALDRKVWLPSGGSLVIDRTEAMTVVDVNTGKFVGSGGNLEETVTKNNLEAAEEIVRQLRLRDIGGIIVVDFIDMVLESNRDLVLRRLVECLSRDRTKHQVAEVTSLGLVQMTRKKLGLGLLESFSEPCEVCAGRGVIVHHDPVTKHRQTAQPETRRNRGKGGNGGSGNGDSGRGNSQSSGQQKGANGSGGGTHAITDDVKNALAQIAASTIAHPADATAAVEAGQPNAESAEASAEGSAAAQGSAVDSAQSPADAKNTDNESRRQTRGERGSERADASPTQTDESPVAADAAVAILDIPVKKSARTSRRISTQDAEQILDSVLDALPEPKQPGQGRSRVSRRASSAGTVTPTSEDSAN
ncbi:MAG: ribonuclease [Microbacteriaceae bacterium]|nr:ribonuclease [Microbacteriaceae bacterium]